MAELFKELESNDLRVFNEAKQKFFEQFNNVKDCWLLNGVYDYYLQSSSTRAMEVLVNITEQHFNFLCDRLIESIRSSKNNAKMQALTLLGFIVRKEPTWLIKITYPHNNLVKELLKLLKTETDVLPLLSALLVVIVLLPIFPAWMGQNHRQDLQDIFSRLAAFNISNPGKVSEEQMVHMQMALFSLFQRLYGMYPCNFISFLRTYYRNKETSPIFMHTIKPMITTVKMHPLLITVTTEYEISNDRWKKMVPHDVILECERYNIKTGERCSNDSCVFAATTTFRSRSGTNPPSYETSQLQVLKGTPMMSIPNEPNFFSPSMLFEIQPVIETPIAINLPQDGTQGLSNALAFLSQEGTSPPEAAVEATPETTPIRDSRFTRQTPQSNVARALQSFSSKSRPSSSSLGTPTNSQPSSPMRKDPSPFSFPSLDGKHSSAFGNPKRDNYSALKLQKMLQDRTQQVFEPPEKKLLMLTPSSPLRIIPPGIDSIPGSPVLPGHRNESPISQEDEEVLAIVGQDYQNRSANRGQCDSVLHDVEGGRATEEDMENCEQEHGSPCTAGGLHMPNSRSMNEFARRLRYYSQCAQESEKSDRQSTESSPGKPTSMQTTVRRANSCPEIKKASVPIKDNIGKILPETAEENATGNGIDDQDKNQDHKSQNHKILNHRNLVRRIPYKLNQDAKNQFHTHDDSHQINNTQLDISGLNISGLSISGLDISGFDNNQLDRTLVDNNQLDRTLVGGNQLDRTLENEPVLVSTDTQTDVLFPMPYEHLFLKIYPSLGNGEISAESPGPVNPPQEESMPDVYQVLDKYINTAVINSDRDSVKNLKEQLYLLYQRVLFEKHQREIATYRNRRLLAEAKNNKSLEEYNSALRDQIQIQQREIDSMRSNEKKLKEDKRVVEQDKSRTVQNMEREVDHLREELNQLTVSHKNVQLDLKHSEQECQHLNKQMQHTEHRIFDAEARVKVANEQVAAAERAREEISTLNRELLLTREMQMRFQERFNDLSLMRNVDEEMRRLSISYKTELKSIQGQLDLKKALLESYKQRVSELEATIAQYEDDFMNQKRLENELKEQQDEKLKVLERKYKAQLAINRKMEENILELWQKIEIATKKPYHSPDVSSCQEANPANAVNQTQPSTPLSASLASSDGALMNLDLRDVRNLSQMTERPLPDQLEESGEMPSTSSAAPGGDQ